MDISLLRAVRASRFEIYIANVRARVARHKCAMRHVCIVKKNLNGLNCPIKFSLFRNDCKLQKRDYTRYLHKKGEGGEIAITIPLNYQFPSAIAYPRYVQCTRRGRLRSDPSGREELNVA